jgi:hypothetical protein
MSAQLALLALQAYLGIVFQKRPHKFTFQELLDSNKGDETRPISYIRGRWKTTPQRIWLGDFTAHAVERDSEWTDFVIGGLIGGVVGGLALAALLDTITVGYRYNVGQGFALTWGPINRVHQVYVQDLACAVAPTVDNAGGSLLLDFPTAFGGDQPPGGGGIYGVCDVIPGTYTQARNPYLQSVEGNIPALHGVAALIIRGESGAPSSGYFSANVLELREWQVELMAWPDVLGTGDAELPDQSFNRIHAMYEWATAADYGAQYPLEKIHLPSWRAAAAQCFTDGLGFSGEINTGGNVGEVFDQLRASVDAEVYEHPRDGLKIKLIRKDYSIPSLQVLSQANCNSVEEYTPGDYADTFNRVTLPYINAENNYQPRPAVYEDPANFQIQRRVASKEINYPGVASAELAQKLVTRDGRVLAQPFPPLVLNSGEVGRNLYPGEVYKFQWSDPLIEKIFRVHARTPSVSYEGEKNFRLTATEDQYSIGMSVFGAPEESDATNPGTIWATAPPSAAWDDARIPPAGLEMFITTGLAGTLDTFIRGAVLFDAYAGGQYARIYVTPPGGSQTLTPIHLSPDANDQATFIWPALIAGTYQFCVQTFAAGPPFATNGVKVCETIAASSFSVSPSHSVSPSVSPSISPSSSVSPSESPSVSPSMSMSPSGSQSPSASQSPSSSQSLSVSPSGSISASISPSASQSPSSSASSSVSPSASMSPSSSVSPSVPTGITFVAAGALGTSTSGTSLSVVAPTLAADDIMVCCIINKSVTANVISPPDGTWTAVIAQEVNNCTLAADDFEYAVFWKRAGVGDSGATFNFTKASQDFVLFAGVIGAWRGAVASGSPLDATAAVRTNTAAQTDNVSFPAYDPTSTDVHVIYIAFYGNDLVAFSAAMSNDTNPDCTTRWSVESSIGNDCAIACTSGDNDGSSIASRTWASNATTDAGNTGIVFALIP